MQENTPQQVDVFDPDGQLGSIPITEVRDAVRSGGFKLASPQEVDEITRKEKFESTGQQIITGLEGAASAATFGLSSGIEKALGVDPADILARREINPGVHALGQAAGVAGTALIPGLGGMSAAKALTGAGEMGAAALGLTGANVASKIGSSATKAAIEGMVFQGGDEVSKMLLKDPNQSLETAVTNIGLSGLVGGGIGGAVGSVSPLWKATAGPKVGEILETIQKRVNGQAAELPDAVMEAVKKYGIEIPDEMKAALSDDAWLKTKYAELIESNSGSGIKLQEGKKQFINDVNDYVAHSLGKDRKGLEKLADLSEDKIGEDLSKNLSGYIKREFEPSIKLFDQFKKKYSNTPLTNEIDTVADKIAEVMQVEFGTSPSSSGYKYGENILKELNHLQTVTDLSKRQTLVWEAAKSGEISWDAAKKYVGVLRDAEEQAIIGAAAKSGPQDVMNLQLARSSYSSAKQAMDELNGYLKLKGYKGPESFISALGDSQNEKILSKLAREDNAGLIKYLESTLPEVSNIVKQYHVDDLLKRAMKGAKDGNLINSKKIFDEIKEMSPEMRGFILGDEGVKKVLSAETILRALPERMNPSGTAKTLESKLAKMTGSAMGTATMLMDSGNPLGFILGPLTKLIGRDAPDAVKLSMLKFLGSGQKIESEAFKVMTDMIQHTIDGENLIAKSAKNLFKGGVDVLPQGIHPTTAQLDKLDKQLEQYQANPEGLFDVGGKTAYYLPEQGIHSGTLAGIAVSYLNSLKPSKDKMNPLDDEPVIDKVQESVYRKALAIAEQPLIVFSEIKSGTLTSQDVMHLKTMYPSLYSKLSQKVYDQIIDVTSKKEKIPYQTRLGLSTFLEQPLDSTMMPQSILANQPIPEQAPQQIAKGTKDLGKMSKMYASSLEISQARHLE